MSFVSMKKNLCLMSFASMKKKMMPHVNCQYEKERQGIYFQTKGTFSYLPVIRKTKERTDF
jgi:hypothetical protein